MLPGALFAESPYSSVQSTRTGWCALKGNELSCRHNRFWEKLSDVSIFSTYRDGVCALVGKELVCIPELYWPRRPIGYSLINPREMAMGPLNRNAGDQAPCFIDDSDLISGSNFAGISCYAKSATANQWGIFRVKKNHNQNMGRPSHLALGHKKGYVFVDGQLYTFSLIRPWAEWHHAVFDHSMEPPYSGKIDTKGYDQMIYASGKNVCLQGSLGVKCYFESQRFSYLTPFYELTELVKNAKIIGISAVTDTTCVCSIDENNKVKCWLIRKQENNSWCGDKCLIKKFEFPIPTDFSEKLKNPTGISISQPDSAHISICVSSDIGLQCLSSYAGGKFEWEYYEVP